MLLRSLPLRILAINFILLALPLLVDSFIFFQRAYDSSIRYAKGALKEAGNFRAFALSELDPVQQVLLKQIIVLLDLEEKASQLPNADFNQTLQHLSSMGIKYHIDVLDLGKEGVYTVLASTDPQLVGKPFFNSAKVHQILQEGQEGDFLEHKFSATYQKEVPFVYVVRLITTTEGEQPLGVLVVSSEIEEALQPLLLPSHDGDVRINYALLNEEEIVYAATNPELVGQFFAPLSAERRQELQNTGQFKEMTLPTDPLSTVREGGGAFFEFVFQNQLQIAYQVNLQKLNLYFLAYAAKEQLFNQSIEHFLLVYVVYGLIFLLGGAVTYWLTFWISRPLKQLSELMERVSQGDLEVHFKDEPLGFEINLLGQIFNNTLTSVLENIQKVEDEKVLKETYQKELEIGREVQQALLPKKIQEVPGIQLAATYIAPRVGGGDFYDIFIKDPQKIALLVADTKGWGISSSFYALSVRSYIRTFLTLYDDAGTILKRVNTLFFKEVSDTGLDVTTLLGLFDTKSGLLQYSSAGHVPGLLRRSNGEMIVLSRNGLALGAAEGSTYETFQVKLEKNDYILFYTDGIIQAMNEKGETFGESRLHQIVRSQSWASAQEVVEGLTTEVQKFIGATTQEEEITILVMKYM